MKTPDEPRPVGTMSCEQWGHVMTKFSDDDGSFERTLDTHLDAHRRLVALDAPKVERRVWGPPLSA